MPTPSSECPSRRGERNSCVSRLPPAPYPSGLLPPPAALSAPHPASRPAVSAARPLPVSRRPRPPVRGGHRLGGRGLLLPRRRLRPLPCGASPPPVLPPGAPITSRLRRPGGRLPGGPASPSLAGCRLGARPRALPARPEGNAPARSWRCGHLPRLLGNEWLLGLWKSCVLTGLKAGWGSAKEREGEKPPPKTAYMNFQALDLPPRSAQ